MIKLQDFAKQQGVTDRAIQKHLKTYAEELEGLYQRKGPNGTWLTEEACEILRSKMKQAPPAVFTPDPRVARLEEELAETKAAAKEVWEQLKQKEKSMALLIEQNNELRLKADSVARLEVQNADLSAENERIDKETKEAIKKAQEAVNTLSGIYEEEKEYAEALEKWTNLSWFQKRRIPKPTRNKE